MKKYVIQYNGVFCSGYVKYHLYQSGKTVPLDNHNAALQWATKFRFKCIANFLCYILNKTDKEFRIFKVIPHNK